MTLDSRLTGRGGRRASPRRPHHPPDHGMERDFLRTPGASSVFTALGRSKIAVADTAECSGRVAYPLANGVLGETNRGNLPPSQERLRIGVCYFSKRPNGKILRAVQRTELTGYRRWRHVPRVYLLRSVNSYWHETHRFLTGLTIPTQRPGEQTQLQSQ